LSGGSLAAFSFIREIAETDAKNHGGHKKKQKKRKHGQQDQPSPPSPPSPPPPPSAITRVDASCVAPTGSVILVDGNARIAQTFTALTSGLLVSAHLELEKDAGTAGDYILQLAPVDNFGTPTNDVLARTTVANLTVPTGASTVIFDFASPFAVVAGTQYALVLTRPAAVNNFWHVLTEDPCLGGAFTSPNQTAPFTRNNANADLVFTTFVQS
jgi:hypothetical protein